MMDGYRKGHQSTNGKTQKRIAKKQRRTERQYLRSIQLTKPKKIKVGKNSNIISAMSKFSSGIKLGDFLKDVL